MVGRDKSVATATLYGLDEPGIESRWWARFSVSVQTGPRADLFPERTGRGVDDPSPFSDEVKERVYLYLYSPSGPSWPVIG